MTTLAKAQAKVTSLEKQLGEARAEAHELLLAWLGEMLTPSKVGDKRCVVIYGPHSVVNASLAFKKICEAWGSPELTCLNAWFMFTVDGRRVFWQSYEVEAGMRGVVVGDDAYIVRV